MRSLGRSDCPGGSAGVICAARWPRARAPGAERLPSPPPAAVLQVVNENLRRCLTTEAPQPEDKLQALSDIAQARLLLGVLLG